jgi:uncharacterized repeat protein (TIGR02543 family)
MFGFIPLLGNYSKGECMKSISTKSARKPSIGLLAVLVALAFLFTACPPGGDTSKTLASIAITTHPTKTTYTMGESLNMAGMVVRATYTNGTTATVTGYTTSGFSSTTAGTQTVTVSYSEDGVTKTATFTVMVSVAQYTVTFDPEGGTVSTPSVTVNSGETVTSLPTPTKTGNTFGGWYTEKNGGGAQFTSSTKVSANATVYARWIADNGSSSISISFSGLPQDETTNISGTPSETLSHDGTINLSVPTGAFPGASYRWYIGNTILSGQTSSTLSKPGSDFTLGQHEITVRIKTADNKVYSKSVRFTVVQ